MSTFKKLLALTLALAMVLSVSAFAGYSVDTYKDVANVTGATVTTSAYKGAVKLAFTTFDLIKGGAAE